MKEYDFALVFELENPNIDAEIYLDVLYESGCDDAVIGIGKQGTLGLDFIRESNSAYDAISSAINNVKSAIPSAKLVHVSPDLVGVKDLADIFNCTRQNMQKFVSKPSFPPPIYKNNQAIWYLTTVLDWFSKNNHQLNQELVDIAKLARHININLQHQLLDPQLDNLAKSLV
jgi:hypothetical protein